MRFRRRQRRPGSQGQWFPTVQSGAGTQINTATGLGTTSLQAVLASGYDDPPNDTTLAGATAAQLANVLRGNSYLVKRVVGSIFVSLSTAIEASATVLAVAGLVIIEQTTAGGIQATEGARWSPFDEGSVQGRWLWRRTWLLGPTAGGFPLTNISYGDVRSGSHIDAKSKARIGYGERLVWVFNAQRRGGTTDVAVTFTPHVRLFGKNVFYPPRV